MTFNTDVIKEAYLDGDKNCFVEDGDGTWFRTREEARNAIKEYTESFIPEKFGFGGALEKEWSHSQGVKTGNMIFVSGQQPYDTNLDENAMPMTDLETGKSFQEQLKTVLGNIEKVLDSYGATMDDVVLLQGFIDEKAGKNAASFDGAAEVIREYFRTDCSP